MQKAHILIKAINHTINTRLKGERTPQQKGLFHVYRLVIDAKPERVMMWASENLEACFGEFLRATASMARKSHFTSSARGGFLFLFLQLTQDFPSDPEWDGICLTQNGTE